MKKIFLFIFSLLFLFASLIDAQPRVFIFTDINIDAGDPDDRQSLIHLLWYANELEIAGIVPDRWNAHGFEACQMVLEAYSKDFHTYDFKQFGYPVPETIDKKIAKNISEAEMLFIKAASENKNPLYVLVWGNMQNFGRILSEHPDIAGNIRLITIGTGLKYGPEDEVTGKNCHTPNWNGPGRNEIFNDSRFNNMWWLEINWTYNGMFSGEVPKLLFEKLSEYGALGDHMKYVTKNHPWAQYFRVGDTPSVLYVIDPTHDPDAPETSSWAGKFTKPFPDHKPNYFTDDNGPVDWNYNDPCKTWENVEEMYAYNKSTLENERAEMYINLIRKLNQIYTHE